MTFSVPSFLAAATSALIPPAALRELAVETFLLLVEEVLPELLPLLQPAANIRVPTAAVATTAYFPRKTFPPRPVWTVHIMARQVGLGVAVQWRTGGWPVTDVRPEGIDLGGISPKAEQAYPVAAVSPAAESSGGSGFMPPAGVLRARGWGQAVGTLARWNSAPHRLPATSQVPPAPRHMGDGAGVSHQAHPPHQSESRS